MTKRCVGCNTIIVKETKDICCDTCHEKVQTYINALGELTTPEKEYILSDESITRIAKEIQ